MVFSASLFIMVRLKLPTCPLIKGYDIHYGMSMKVILGNHFLNAGVKNPHCRKLCSKLLPEITFANTTFSIQPKDNQRNKV